MKKFRISKKGIEKACRYMNKKGIPIEKNLQGYKVVKIANQALKENENKSKQ
tara:strand:+ start:512 stop:667 length:156 start_codon:yes stop_codon:yes gene_type:complete